MKNLFSKCSLGIAILSILVLASCSKEQNQPKVDNSEKTLITAHTPVITKSYFTQDSPKVKWNEADQISVFGTLDGEQENFKFDLEDGADQSTGTFAYDKSNNQDANAGSRFSPKFAAFPYAKENNYSEENDGTLTLKFPAKVDMEEGRVDSPMFGKFADNSLQFESLGGCLRIIYKNAPKEAKTLEFKSNSEQKFGGVFEISGVNTGKLNVKLSENDNGIDPQDYIVFELKESNDKRDVEVIIPFLGDTFELKPFTVVLCSSNDIGDEIAGTSVTSSKNITITKGKVKTMKPIEIKAPEVKKVSVQEFLDAEVSDTQWYELTGTITSISNTTYGNFDIKDNSGSVYIYGLTATKQDKNDQSFSSLGLNIGDVITIHTLRKEHDGKPEGGGPAYFVSMKEMPKISVTGENSIAFDQTSLELNVSANCDWKVSAKSEGLTVTPESGNGDGTVKVSFAKNDTEDAKEYSITFEATLDGETQSVTFTFLHKEEGGVFVPETFYEITLGKNLPEGWSAENAYYDKDYPRFGASKKPGSATTCALGITSPKAKFTFEIAAWDNNNEVTKLNLSIIGDGKFADGSKTKLIEGYALVPSFTPFEEIIEGANSETKIKFESKNKTKNRFFIKSVKVESCE